MLDQFAYLLPMMIALAIIIPADVILRILVAIFVTHDFEWEKIGEFLVKYVPMIIGWLLMEAFKLIPPGAFDGIPLGGEALLMAPAAALVVYGVIVVTALTSVMGHLKALGLFPGGVIDVLGRAGIPTTGAQTGDGRPGISGEG